MNGIQALQHMGVHLDALQRENEVLRAALRQLIVMARTSGGTAGADAELMKACGVAESAIAKAKGE